MSALRVTPDESRVDTEWDAFVEASPDGHHLQTSRWAQVKGVQGWRGVRLKVYDGEGLAGGCQLLVRRVAGLTAIAYAPRGPIAHRSRVDVLDAVVTAVEQAARRRRVVYLKVQPPVTRWDMLPHLARRGFTASGLSAAPDATVRVDLRPDLDELLRRMGTSTRRNIRRSERRGVSVRIGGDADLPTLWSLIVATSQRQGFEPYPWDYYLRMWHAFAPGGQVQLFMAERAGQSLAAQVVIAFGDTVLAKVSGWSGEGADVYPNEALLWAVMRWAKAQGYTWFDFEGINREVATALLQGEDARSIVDGPSSFKLGFGGEVTVFPGAVDRVPWPLLAPALRRGEHSKAGQLVLHRLLGRRPQAPQRTGRAPGRLTSART